MLSASVSSAKKLLRQAIERIAPEVAVSLREHRQRNIASIPEARDPKQVFAEIYATKKWGGQEEPFNSGSGSTDEVAKAFVDFTSSYVFEHAIRSIVDLGCGDFRVGAKLAAPRIRYTGIDVVPELVRHNSDLYGTEEVSFASLDIINDPLPVADLYVLRQVLQHLSNDQIARVLEKLRPARHVIIAEHHPAPSRFRSYNHDKPIGSGIRACFGSGVYPDKSPFEESYVAAITTTVVPVVTDGEFITIYVKAAAQPRGQVS